MTLPTLLGGYSGKESRAASCPCTSDFPTSLIMPASSLHRPRLAYSKASTPHLWPREGGFSRSDSYPGEYCISLQARSSGSVALSPLMPQPRPFQVERHSRRLSAGSPSSRPRLMSTTRPTCLSCTQSSIPYARNIRPRHSVTSVTNSLLYPTSHNNSRSHFRTIYT